MRAAQYIIYLLYRGSALLAVFHFISEFIKLKNDVSVELGKGVYLVVNHNASVEIGDKAYIAADSKI